MALLHDLSHLNRSGMDALRTIQRDWSPYLVHFTSWTAMKEVRQILNDPRVCPYDADNGIAHADKISFCVVERIFQAGNISATVGDDAGKMKRVCLSECNLPGLMGHVERFGRFGFVFDKFELFERGARPCVYVDSKQYGELVKNKSPLLPLANVYRPIPRDGKIQDYMVEREWRCPTDIPLSLLRGFICPDAYFSHMQSLLQDKAIPLFPIDMLYAWGV